MHSVPEAPGKACDVPVLHHFSVVHDATILSFVKNPLKKNGRPKVCGGLRLSSSDMKVCSIN